MRNCSYHNEKALKCHLNKDALPGKNWQLPYMVKENWLSNVKDDGSLFKVSV